MSRLLRPVLGAASIAADVSGVPGAGAAADILNAIQDHCEKVASHKVCLLQ